MTNYPAPSSSLPTSTATRPAFRPRVRRLARVRYEIESRTEQGRAYVVTLTGRETHTCTCPAFEHGRDCWHHAAALKASAFFSKWYSQAVPVMAPTTTAAPAPEPAAIPFHQTRGYQRLAEAFA